MIERQLYLKMYKEYLDNPKGHKIPDRDLELKIIKLSRDCDKWRDLFLMYNYRLVVNEASKYTFMRDHKEDLSQWGFLGLMHALKKFDETKGFKFSTYAVAWIRQRINRAIINHTTTIRIPVNMADLFNKAIVVINKIQKKEEKTLNDEERVQIMADVLNISRERACQIYRLNLPISSLNRIINEDTEIINLIVDHEKSIDSLYKNKNENEVVMEAVYSLDERTRDMIIRNYGLNDETPQSLSVIGKDYGITRERVRQLIINGFGKIRKKQEIKNLHDEELTSMDKSIFMCVEDASEKKRDGWKFQDPKKEKEYDSIHRKYVKGGSFSADQIKTANELLKDLKAPVIQKQIAEQHA